MSLSEVNLAIISPLNDETGIASYTEQLFAGIEKNFQSCFYFANSNVLKKTKEDASIVLRNWQSGDSDVAQLIKDIQSLKINVVHIEHHPGAFLSLDGFEKLIRGLNKLNLKIVLSLHSVRSNALDMGDLASVLNLANKIIVHSKSDFEYLKLIVDNCNYSTMHIPKWGINNKVETKNKLDLSRDFIIATHGLINNNKNLDKIIDAFNLFAQEVPKSKLLLLNALSVNNISAKKLFDDLTSQINKLGISEKVVFLTDFLDDNEILTILNAVDLYVLAYSDVGESGSGAIRKGISSEVPIICTAISQFEDFKDEVFKVKSADSNLLVEAMKKLHNEPQLRERLIYKTEKFKERHSVKNKQEELLNIFVETYSSRSTV